ncbi:MAG: hypothetical protein H0T79_18920, partial [Deltaproteobacteria bacterium]|nr:hypothetical protein [Deltaproteobacteria bacterium]
MVVATESNQGAPDVLLHELDAPLVGPAWSEGWHTGIALDYGVTLGTHADAFVATPPATLVPAITDQLTLGAHISVFASSGDTASSSAHLIHRNGSSEDGAIVIDPDGPTPHYLLMRYDEQIF